jgi:hypothetical protein
MQHLPGLKRLRKEAALTRGCCGLIVLPLAFANPLVAQLGMCSMQVAPWEAEMAMVT